MAVVSLLMAYAHPAAAELQLERLDGTFVESSVVEARVLEIMQQARLPGLQIAVVNGGQVVYTAGFGVKSSRTGTVSMLLSEMMF